MTAGPSPFQPPPGPDEQKRRRSVALVGAAVFAAVVCLVAFVAIGRFGGPPASSTSRLELSPTPNVIVAMRELSRLETETFHMERVIELTDEQTHLFGLVQSKDALLLVAVGDVTAGIDLGKLAEGDVVTDWANKRAHVKLPAAEVFSASLDNARTHVVTRSTDTLAERREDLEGQARSKAEAGMKSAAIEGGILTRAGASGERQVRSLLASMGFSEIVIDAAKP